MKTSLTELWIRVADELAAQCDVSASRDVKTLQARVDHEGESFLTITLPSFARDFERALDIGRVTPEMFASFGKHLGLPSFLRGFLELVFDTRTLMLLSEPNVDAIYTIRQLTLLFKKLEGDCSEERNRAALDSYINCEEELKAMDTSGWDAEALSELRRLGYLYYGDAVNVVGMLIESYSLEPSHGPGFTADDLRGNQKFAQVEWPERLEAYLPYGEYVLPRWGYLQELLPDLQFLAPGEERPVKVVLVPKTRKTPRVIAMEPTAMQYAQQAILASLVPALENNHLDMLGFTDQSPNRDLACEGSRNGSLATLDLSEASDRVSNTLVRAIFSPEGAFGGCLQACRSRSAVLEDGRSVRLSKFASMGSAVCFPIEAMVFLAIVLYGIQATECRRLTRDDVISLGGRVRIYGDDIIIPIEYVEEVVRALESFGLKVNTNKSFWTGKFRESCGGDYYDGRDVTPTYLRRYLPTSRENVTGVLGWVATLNGFYQRGLLSTADFMHEQIKPLLGALPYVESTSPALGIVDPGLVYPDGLDIHTHTPYVRAWVPSFRYGGKPLDNWGALRKIFTGDFTDPMYEDHLKFSGRPVSARITRRRAPVR